jgi:xanthine dehydrogenase accessory factor
LIKGAGDLATGVALRLRRAGLPVVMTELAQPTVVRRAVAFAQAVFDGETQVEELRARRATPDQIADLLAAGITPLLIDPAATVRAAWQPAILIDAVMAKRNLGTRRDDAPLVVALGPGFCAGVDCHAVVETQRGHTLGRVIWQGSALPDTGIPGILPGMAAGTAATLSRVLRAPIAGYVRPYAAIGDQVAVGATLAVVHDQAHDQAQAKPQDRLLDHAGARPVVAPFSGVLRGLIHPTVRVTAGLKIGDLDPRALRDDCFTASDKALAIGGGVLEAILLHLRARPRAHESHAR